MSNVRDVIRGTKPVIQEFTLKDGSKIWLRAFNGVGRAQFNVMMEKAKGNGGVHAEVVAAMAICEEDGTIAYDWQKDADLDELRKFLDGQDIDAIGVMLFQMSGLTKEAQEDATKN